MEIAQQILNVMIGTLSRAGDFSRNGLQRKAWRHTRTGFFMNCQGTCDGRIMGSPDLPSTLNQTPLERLLSPNCRSHLEKGHPSLLLPGLSKKLDTGWGSSSRESDSPHTGTGSSPMLGAPVGMEVLPCFHLLKRSVQPSVAQHCPALLRMVWAVHAPVLASTSPFFPPIPPPSLLLTPIFFCFLVLAPLVCSPLLFLFLHHPLLPMVSLVFI